MVPARCGLRAAGGRFHLGRLGSGPNLKYGTTTVSYGTSTVRVLTGEAVISAVGQISDLRYVPIQLVAWPLLTR
jgi:hypothetical protein